MNESVTPSSSFGRFVAVAFVAFVLICNPLAVDAQTKGPEAPDLPPVPVGEAWRAERPVAGEPRAPVLPSFEKAVLPNGLTVLVAEQRGLPLVSYRLVIKGGSSQDPEGQAGLTDLTFAMLQEGADDLDALAFSDRIADLGAYFGVGADRDEGSAGISGLARHRETMMSLLASAVLRPRMTEADFDRLKNKTLAGLVRRRGSPRGLASEFFPKLIYGAQHPYGRPISGVPETVQALTLEDVKAQYGRLVAPRHAALIAVGDVDLASTQALAKSLFGDWNSAGEDLKPVPAVKARRRRSVMIVDKPKTPQTFVMFGRPLFGRGDANEIRLRLANLVFGGSFASRLNMNLREDKGYTYGANSAVSLRTGAGAFVGYSEVRSDVTVEALREMFRELKGLRERPASAEEVRDAKLSRVRSVTGQFQTIGASASAASAIFVYDLPLDYFSELPNRYEAATLEEVRAAATGYLKPQLMHILLVGDAQAMRRKLQAARFGRIRTVEPPPAQPGK